MATTDARVDAYIAKSPDFAKPILARIRAAVHKGCPGVKETLKWSSPSYEDGGILCLTAAFTRHCAWIFWTGRAPMSVDVKPFRRLTSIADLPPERTLVALVKEAVGLKKAGVKPPPRPRVTARPVRVPAYLIKALTRSKKALSVFEAFPPSHRREYVEWIGGAKTAETRERRIATAIAWMAAGKSRNWKYQKQQGEPQRMAPQGKAR